MMVAQGLYRFVHRRGDDHLRDGAIQSCVHLHPGGRGRRCRRSRPTGTSTSTVKAPRGLLGQTLPDGGCGGLTTSGPHYTPNTHSTPRRTFHRLFHRQLLHKGRLAWSARSLRSIPNANRTARPDLEFFLAWVLPLHQNSRMGKNDI